MQASGVPAALLGRAAPISRLIRSDSASRRVGAASALFAPAAMMAGALGLAGLWGAMPKPLPDASPQISSPAPLLAAVAPRLDAGGLGRWLNGLGAPVRLLPAPSVTLTQTADQALAELNQVERDMVSAADLDARARLRAMRATFKATGLDVRPYLAADADPAPGVSRAELKDPRILAARFDLDPRLARQVQQAARDLVAVQSLGRAAAALPLATPVDNPIRSSPFGERADPFTGQTAFHPGQDFAGRYGEPIHVTAPGVVSFVGQRSGYGNCVEVDHGYGFKTRYGHLSGFTLGVGTPVKIGDVIGRMGSTGRSTGVHLHYEVWASGRLLNPTPFLNAGASAQRRS